MFRRMACFGEWYVSEKFQILNKQDKLVKQSTITIVTFNHYSESTNHSSICFVFLLYVRLSKPVAKKQLVDYKHAKLFLVSRVAYIYPPSVSQLVSCLE